MRALPDTDIYAITDSRLSLGRSVNDVVAALLDSGVKIIQYREKWKKAGEMLRECEALREMTRSAGAFFIVNDHISIAQLVEADGVHIGQEDLPLAKVRELVGEHCVIGLSTHSPQQAMEAVKNGADYIGVGPIYATQTKEDVCAPVGLEYLRYVAENISIPFVSIGGIKRHNIADVVRHGGKCCCLISEIVGAHDITARVREIRACMQEKG